jgi:hypothetical protein
MEMLDDWTFSSPSQIQKASAICLELTGMAIQKWPEQFTVERGCQACQAIPRDPRE